MRSNPMTCADLEARLTEFLEGELDPATEAAALEHVAGCPRCDTVLRGTRRVMSLARDHGSLPLAADRRDAMLSALLDAARRQSD